MREDTYPPRWPHTEQLFRPKNPRCSRSRHCRTAVPFPGCPSIGSAGRLPCQPRVCGAPPRVSGVAVLSNVPPSGRAAACWPVTCGGWTVGLPSLPRAGARADGGFRLSGERQGARLLGRVECVWSRGRQPRVLQGGRAVRVPPAADAPACGPRRWGRGSRRGFRRARSLNLRLSGALAWRCSRAYLPSTRLLQ